jgi:hypothetical protein
MQVRAFRSRFIGKCRPAQFFWGSFDLAGTRFSGRQACLPKNVDLLTREAYSHEVISCGFGRAIEGSNTRRSTPTPSLRPRG